MERCAVSLSLGQLTILEHNRIGTVKVMARKITYGVPYTPRFCILFELKRATDHTQHIFILNTFITLLLKVTLNKFRQIVTRMPTHGLAFQLTHNGSLSKPVLPGNQLTTV